MLDLADIIGEEEVQSILSDFSCEKNMEIEVFVRKIAFDFSKKKMSVTYLVFNEDTELAAIFALTHKAVQIGNDGLSKTAKKKMQRFAQLDEESNAYVISAFLIAQFGKNSGYHGEPLSGNHLMSIVEDVLVQYYKENPEGVGKMCEAMDRIAEKRAVEARIENALKMIARGKLTLEEIAEDSGLSLEKVKELADKRTA